MEQLKQGYKQTDIGVIPEDWEVKELGKISLNMGYGVGATAVNYDGTNKYIRITDIDDETHSFIPSPIMSPSFFTDSNLANDGDILFARTGASVGKSYIYNRNDGRLIIAGFLIRLNIYDAHPKYVFFSTLTKRYKEWVLSESVRSGQPGLNLEQYKSFQIPIPKKTNEQIAIATALSDVDALIAASDKKITKKQQIKQGAMQQLLTGKKRLPGFNGKWVEKKIEEISNTSSGGTPYRNNKDYYKGSIPWVTTSELNDGFVKQTNENITEDALRNSSAKIFPEGTVLMAMYGATIGKLGILAMPAATNQASCAFLCKEDEIDYKYLFYKLLFIRNELVALGCGAGQPNISQSIIKVLYLLLPPTKSEQTAIAQILTDMDDEITQLEAERNKYKQIKSGMMQQLLTGNIRII
ncbi:MAG: restriction endonuclease subunit S [Bacteroidales bacterium]|nr:restriction endonuclease subunit S [Bacteroidales bacterium]